MGVISPMVLCVRSSLYSRRQASITTWASCNVRNQCSFKHSSRNLPLKMSYEAAKKRAEPYTKIVEELPQMRRETVHLMRQAVSEGRRAYVLVNNRSEGNAPLTVQALAEMLRT
jgi:hypothetical protein